MNENIYLPGLLVGGALVTALYSWYRPRSEVPLPPGPKGNLFLGNALEIQNCGEFWLKFSEYADQYGPLVTIRVITTHVFLLSEPHLAHELFEKRAANYSDRDASEMTKLAGWDQEVVFLSYGPKFKTLRTMLHRALNSRAALDYVPIQQYEVLRFMRRLIETPGDFFDHTHLLVTSVALRIAYGYKVQSADDRFAKDVKESMAAFADALTPAKWMVDFFPPLRYLPTWFPFAAFHRYAQHIRKLDHVTRGAPFDFVLKQLAEGVAEDSFTSKLLQTEDGEPVDNETREDIKVLASTMYSGAIDATVSGVQSFFLAMTLYPEAQSKAQAEISTYLQGQRRTLVPADRTNLPYTSALVREILRWHPINSIIAHRTSDADDCNVAVNGKTYRIPARSVVIGNLWKMMHDPNVYPEPEKFKPERYLAENPPPGPESYAFGFGRRICPGIHIAQQTMWISISNTLANFTISKAKDENGLEITPEEQYTIGVISHPLPFNCSVTPREGCEQWLRAVGE